MDDVVTPTQRRGATTRQRIVTTAAELFHGRGYAATGLSHILKRVRLTKGSFYHHFRSKKAVALAVIHEVVAPTIQRRMIDPVAGAKDPLAAVVKVMADIRTHIATEALLTGCPLNNLATELAVHDGDLQRAVASIFSAWEVAWTQAFHRAGRADARALSLSFMAAIEGAQSIAKAVQRRDPLDVVFETFERGGSLVTAAGPRRVAGKRRAARP